MEHHKTSAVRLATGGAQKKRPVLDAAVGSRSDGFICHRGANRHISTRRLVRRIFLRSEAPHSTIRRTIKLLGTELDANPQRSTKPVWVTTIWLECKYETSFWTRLKGSFQAIVANPPYIRHHRLSTGTKDALKLLAKRLIGTSLDGRTGFHYSFSLRL